MGCKYTPVHSQRKLRGWQVFPGNNLFLCNGRIITSNENGPVVFTSVMTVIVAALWGYFSGPYLWNNLSPAAPVVGGYLIIITMSMLAATSWTDPGIVPRADEAESKAAYPEPTNVLEIQTPRIRGVKVKGISNELKFCHTCQIFRPPRCSHCSTCDNCVDGFDHHCPWVGNCVGARNYRYFYSYVWLMMFSTMYVMGTSMWHIAKIAGQPDASLSTAVEDKPSAIVVIVICFFAFWSVFSMAFFHMFLVNFAMTTNESIKRTFRDGRNPYSRGSGFKNHLATLFGPRRPSLLNLRGIVDQQFDIDPDPPMPKTYGSFDARNAASQPGSPASFPTAISIPADDASLEADNSSNSITTEGEKPWESMV